MEMSNFIENYLVWRSLNLVLQIIEALKSLDRSEFQTSRQEFSLHKFKKVELKSRRS